MLTLVNSILKHPSLDAFPARIEGGALPALVSGLGPVHRVHLAAALYQTVQRPLVVLCPDDTTAETVSKDLIGFLGKEPLLLTAREITIHAALAVSREDEQKRIAVLDALVSERADLVVCTVSGLLQRTMPPAFLQSAAVTIAAQMTIAPETVEQHLLRCGYLRTEQVEGPGQYARHGFILDFFSPVYEAPVRCEFWGDEIDTIGFFDIGSQRRTENIASCRIVPAHETLPAVCDREAVLAEQLLQLAERYERTRRDEKTLVQTLREDAERAKNGTLPAADRYMDLIYDTMTCALDYLPPDALLYMVEPGKTAERALSYGKQILEDVRLKVQSGTLLPEHGRFFLPWDQACQAMEDFPVVMADAFTVGRYPLEPRTIVGISAKQLSSYNGNLEIASSDVSRYMEDGFAVVVLAGDSRRAEVLRETFEKSGISVYLDETLSVLPEPGRCAIAISSLSAGFEYPELRLAVLTDTQIIRGGFRPKKRRKALSKREKIGSCADLAVGDLVVHEHHGIGRYAGIFKMPVDGVEKDYIKICYAGADSLYVPATQLDLIAKYVGGGEDKPVKLSKMGGTDWHRAKNRAKAAAKDMAKKLTALYASRQREKGYAFSPDSVWQTEFESSFPWQETDDQLRCIAEIKADMERPVPMDRLLCGDVGYGKTEVALRAVMKCVLDGKQAAILVPTTVLAQQHYQTAMQRFFGYPVTIELLSRFRTGAQMKKSLQNIRDGKADIIIGTHRLLQKDIQFHNLGLLIVDEEQRFGVAHKERLKEMSRQVDVLTLSATPIPRTLNMALSGIRDMSTLEEPPQHRLPIQTYVMEHDWGVICDAIRREVQRGGQVYYLHNRVETIDRVASRLADMLEQTVSVAVAHGKMDEESLSTVMESMMNGETQVLVCTTIIETGIDIPNVNTLIIEDADRLGLAQLHQIRGRVGRSSRRAYAYLTFRKDKVLSEVAEKRLSAIREFAEFNSGFRIAMRDLEIRGAGNLLGAEQSGHMIDVGYDMYLKLLEEAVLEERGETPVRRAECSADLTVYANIPAEYVPSQEQRMDLYRRIALVRTEADADDILDELIDRFGDPPSSVNALVQVALLRGEAAVAGICDISQKKGALRFVLNTFDMQKVSALYEMKAYKGRLRVEAGQKPCLSLRLNSQKRIIEQARTFAEDYRNVTVGETN